MDFEAHFVSRAAFGNQVPLLPYKAGNSNHSVPESLQKRSET